MASPQPPDFGQLIARLAREFSARELAFMLIGGQAVLLHGAPRLTEDIDVTLGVGPERLASVREACDALGLNPLPTDVESFVQDTFVLPVREASTGVRVDLIFSTTPYERQAIARAQRVSIAGVPVPFATAEDLIIHKLLAGRPRDLEDATGVEHPRGPTRSLVGPRAFPIRLLSPSRPRRRHRRHRVLREPRQHLITVR